MRQLLLLVLLAGAAAVSAATVQPEGFWITAELLRVDWKEGCLTTGGCSHPRFKIVKEIQSMKEKVSISWPVSEHFVQESSRQFVSHWSSGIPDEVSLSCQITGNDPVYAFPRVCDQTSASKPFRGANADDVFGRYRRHDGVVVETIEADDRKKVIEVRGRCFNATLVVQKHTERCPWCPDPAALSVIANELPEEAQISSSPLLGLSDSQLLQAGVFGLALLTVIVTGLLCCFVVAYCRQKSTLKKRTVSVKPRHHTYVYQQEDERRYDAPWEQQGRPLTYGLFSNTNSCSKSETNTTTSPLDSSSSIGFYSHRALVPPPSTRIYHQIGSPNSTSTLGGSGPHDDSGLESV